MIKHLPKNVKPLYAGGASRSQKLIEAIRQRVKAKAQIEERQHVAADKQPFAPLDVTKAVDAPFPADQGEQHMEVNEPQASSSSSAPSTQGNPQKRPATSLVDDLWEQGEKPELKKPAKGNDLEPWSDEFYGLLQAVDYPTGDPDDDLMGEEELPPAARRVSKEMRRLVRKQESWTPK